MIEAMVAGGQQALEPTNETMYFDYYPPDYHQYPGQGSPDLCPPLYDYGNVTCYLESSVVGDRFHLDETRVYSVWCLM